MNDAKLIVLEGLDGSGKSTQISLIQKYLEKHNLKYEYIHFPIYGDNEASNVISAYLRGEYGDINNVNPIFVANMYAMDRYLYFPKLQKQLLENDVVLLDRYVFSNMAFQGAKYLTETQAQIMRDWINEFEFGFLELPYPDLNIFLDVPLDSIEHRLTEKREGADREYLQGKVDIHEKDIEFQHRVRENYLALEGYQGYKIVETGNLLPEGIFEKYVKYIDNILFNKMIE